MMPVSPEDVRRLGGKVYRNRVNPLTTLIQRLPVAAAFAAGGSERGSLNSFEVGRPGQTDVTPGRQGVKASSDGGK
jgi:hypothetical protein